MINLEDIEHIARNMRASDRREVYGMRRNESPASLAFDTWLLLDHGRGHIACHDSVPAIVCGVIEVWPGVWQAMAFGTDAFERAAPAATRYILREIKPWLIEQGCHRLECFSHVEHTKAHRWLVFLGATCEGSMKAFGRDGSDYLRFAWTR